MVKYIFLCCLTLVYLPFSHPQNKVALDFGYSYFLHNSENSMRIMGDKKFESHLIYGVSYSREDILGINLFLKYSYSELIEEKTLWFFRTAQDNPTIMSSYGADISLIMNKIDFSYIATISHYLSVGIGPSILFTNRIIEVIIPPLNEEKGNLLYDKLASSGFGGNTFLDFSFPINEGEKYFFLTSKLLVRYTHSFWFDEKGRNLDNYKQEFLDTNVSIGIGYSF